MFTPILSLLPALPSLPVSLAPSSKVPLSHLFPFALSSEQWGLSLWLSWPPGWFPPNPPLPSSKEGSLAHALSQLALSCLKATRAASLQPSSRGPHQQQNPVSALQCPLSLLHTKVTRANTALRWTQPIFCILSHLPPCSKPSFHIGSSLIPLPSLLDSWNSITFFPGHCCLAYLQGYGFHGAAITRGHEPGRGGLTAMEMHSLPHSGGRSLRSGVGGLPFPPEALRRICLSGQYASLWPCHFNPSMWLLVLCLSSLL